MSAAISASTRCWAFVGENGIRRQNSSGVRQRHGETVLPMMPHQPQRGLVHQHLLKGQAASGALQILQAVREMRLANGIVQFAQPMADPQGTWQRLRAAVVHLGQRGEHHIPEGLGGDTLHGLVHWLDGRFLHLHGVLQYASSVFLRHAAEEHDAFSHRQVLADPGLVIPGQGQPAGLIPDGGRNPGQPVKAGQLGRIGHHAHDHHFPRPGQGTGCHLCPILVTDRQAV